MSVVVKFKHQQPSEDQLITNLQKLMREHHISEAELSRQTEVPQPTLHKILSGKTADPRISTLKILADFFEISVDDLLANDLQPTHKALPQGASIPVITWEDCKDARQAINKLTPTNWDQWVLVDREASEHLYGLISRPSMEPYFPRGTTLIVDAHMQPSDGDLVVVFYPNTSEATLRELSIDGPQRMLSALSQNAVPEKMDNAIKIVGIVVQSRFCY